MKASKWLILILIIMLLSAAAWYGVFRITQKVIPELSSDQLTTEQKLADFDYLYHTMKENYPYFDVKKRMTNYDWLAQKGEFEGWIKESKNDREFGNAINRIIKLAQSGHTNLVNYNFYKDIADIYSDPLKGYSPARRNILKNELVADKVQYWNRLITTYDHYMPLIIKYVEGNYVVFDGELVDLNIPQGSILKTVEQQAVDEYIKTLGDKIYLEYDYKRHKQIAGELYIFTEPGAVMSFTFQTPSGEFISRDIKQREMSPAVYDRYYEGYSNRNFRTEILEKNKAAYIRISSMMVNGDGQYEEDRKEIEAFLKQIKDYPYLIIDIRGNGGGSTGYWSGALVSRLIEKSVFFKSYILYRDTAYNTPFVKDRYDTYNAKSTQDLPANNSYAPEVKNFGKYIEIQDGVISYNPLHFTGKIYLLVDGGVYSAAESFAVFAKTAKWATLVGTTTGGDGIGAEPGYISLPNSGVLIRVPVAMGLNPDGTINEETHTQPDIYVEPSYQDVLAQLENNENPMTEISNHDTVLNYVLKQIQEGK